MQFPETAISPCPNDTFAFFGFAEKNRAPLTYLDIEQLNLALLEGRYDFAKGSFAIMEKIAADYEILSAGAAIGRGVGPVFVGNIGARAARVALPGENTTAHRLFRYWQKQNDRFDLVVEQMPFHRMLSAIEGRTADAAILIHEGRFVYRQRGLSLIEDLGAYWEKTTGAMIPLGCIYARKRLPVSLKQQFAAALRESIGQSLSDFAARSERYQSAILPFMLGLAQENDAAVAEAHVTTYVTDDTVELGAEALKSIDVFRQKCLI